VVPFALEEYNLAAGALWLESVDGLIAAHSPWLAQIERERSENLRSSRVSIEGTAGLVFDPVHTDTSGTLPIGDIVAGDLTAVLAAIDAEALSEAATLEAALLERFRSLTDATGNVIDTPLGGLSHDLIRTLVERMDVDFDSDGQPQFEFFVTGTAATAFAALPPLTREQNAAWDEMIVRKREGWQARRQRRLARPTAPASPNQPADPPPPADRLFATPEYNTAATVLLRDHLEARTTDHSPSLALFPRVASEAPRPSIARHEGLGPATIEPIRIRTLIERDVSEAVDGDISRLRERLDDAARARAERLVEFWQAAVDQAPGVGSIRKGEQPLSWDSLMDAMEDMPIGFDADGNSTMRIVVGPQAPELGPRTRQQDARLAQLLERKQQEFDARRRRRLVP
jgi:hypothetical protein